MIRRQKGTVFVAGLALVAAACGSANPARNPQLAGGDHCPPGAGFTGPVNDHGAVPVKGATAGIEAGDFFFSPTCQIGAPMSGSVTLVVHNGGATLHNVSVPDQSVDTDVEPGHTVTVTITAKPTSFTFFCKYHRASGMVGAVIPGAP